MDLIKCIIIYLNSIFFRIVTELRIFFESNHYFAMKRSELIGVIDFLSNCGGFLGLFMGFSMMSFVDLTYNIILNLKCKKQTNIELVSIVIDDNRSAKSDKINEPIEDEDCDQNSLDIIIESLMSNNDFHMNAID